MNRKFLIAAVAMFFVSMVKDLVVHGMLLGQEYAKLGALFRSPEEQQKLFTWMLLAHAMIAASLVWVYAQGRRDAPWLAQGVRFGLAIAFLTVVPGYIIYYAIQPMPGDLVVKQVVYDTIGTVLLGMAVAALYRKA
jgi:hypothetical protein